MVMFDPQDKLEFVVLPSEEWREMLAAAAVLDLVHGGYFRAQPCSIRFYCGPENAPEGWSARFPDGSPDLPRALVGEAEGMPAEEENQILVRLIVSNWHAMRRVKAAYDRGEFRDGFQEYVLAQESALRGRPEERFWLRAQFDRLRAHATGAVLESRDGAPLICRVGGIKGRVETP
jgi:hypothetical protein